MANVYMGKYGIFGFGVQASKGSANTSMTWVPIPEDPDFSLNPNWQELDQADLMHSTHAMFSSGAVYEGGVTLRLVPGCISNLVSWALSKDSYNQNSFATVALIQGDGTNTTGTFAQDVKVNSIEFAYNVGEICDVSLDLTGISEVSDGDQTTIIGNLPADASSRTVDDTIAYYWQEVSAVLNATSGGSDISSDMTSATISIDNQVEDPADGLRFGGNNFPTYLREEGGYAVTGSVSREKDGTELEDVMSDSVDTTSYDFWEYTPMGYIQMALSRSGATAGLTLTVSHCRFTSYDSGQVGSRTGKQVESLDFTGLGSRTVGDNSAISVSVT